MRTFLLSGAGYVIIKAVLLFRKLRWVLTNRILKFFLEQAKRDKEKYLKFYEDYGLFFREGIVTTTEQDQRVKATLLYIESFNYLFPFILASILNHSNTYSHELPFLVTSMYCKYSDIPEYSHVSWYLKKRVFEFQVQLFRTSCLLLLRKFDG